MVKVSSSCIKVKCLISYIVIPISESVKLMLGKIIKTVATRCHVLKLKCTKFDFGWGSTPDSAGEAYALPQTPIAGFKGAYF